MCLLSRFCKCVNDSVMHSLRWWCQLCRALVQRFVVLCLSKLQPQRASGLLQGRLNTMIGKTSGFLETLPRQMRARIEFLRELQDKHDDLYDEYNKELLELRKKYEALYGEHADHLHCTEPHPAQALLKLLPCLSIRSHAYSSNAPKQHQLEADLQRPTVHSFSRNTHSSLFISAAPLSVCCTSSQSMLALWQPSYRLLSCSHLCEGCSNAGQHYRVY